MPVVVGPAVTPTAPVVSADGVLTVTPRSEWAAVKVTVDFTALLSGSTAASVWTVSVTHPDGTVVRGLDRLVAPRGVCVGWDQEFATGLPATWTALCFDRAGALVATSAAVSTTMPRPARTWIKDLTDPRLSAAFVPESEMTPLMPRPTVVASPFGARFPSVATGVRQAGAGALPLHTLTVAEADRLRVLLAGGPAYLIQPGSVAAGNGFRDFYAVIGDVQESAISAAHAYRGWSLPVTLVARPATAGSTIPVPGLTFGEAPAVSWASRSGRIVDYTGV